MKPATDKVIIILDDQEEVSKGGIIIPKSQRDKPATGTVHSVGRMKTGEEVPLKAGARVIFNRFDGVDFEEQGIKYKVLRYGNILCELEEGRKVEAPDWVADKT